MEIVLVGFSGHAFVCISTAQLDGWKVKGYINPQKASGEFFPEIPYLGNETDPSTLEKIDDAHLFLGIGWNDVREKVYKSFQNKYPFANIIHPSSIIDSTVQMKDGVLVSAGAVINAFVRIGTGAIINSGAIVEHECSIGDFSHVATGAVLCGDVSLGQRSFVGAGAVVKQCINIGDDVIIGAGAVVLKDVPSGTKIVGNPAKPI